MSSVIIWSILQIKKWPKEDILKVIEFLNN